LEREDLVQKLVEEIDFTPQSQKNDLVVFLNYIKTVRRVDRIRTSVSETKDSLPLYFQNCAVQTTVQKSNQPFAITILENEDVKTHHRSVYNKVKVDKSRLTADVEKLNEFGYQTYSGDALYNFFKKMAPRTCKFLCDKFDYQSTVVVQEHVTAILRLLILGFLKNYEP